MTQWKTPVFAEIDTRLTTVDDRIRALAGWKDDALHWSPEAGRWSAAQVLDHLRVTAAAYEPQLDAALERGRATATSSADLSWKPGMLGRMFLSFLAKPRRLKAPKSFHPESPRPEHVVERTLEAQTTLRERLRSADGLSPRKVKVTTPISPLMRFQLADCFMVLASHAERHLDQIDRLRDHSDFPA